MRSKVLLDTNVMLDLALARPEGFDAAATIAEAVAYEEVVAYVCATSLKDLYYILSKAMGEKDARTYIKAVMDDFIICSVDYALCRQAADSDEPDFEDGLVRACAENARVDFIVTRDGGATEVAPMEADSRGQLLQLLLHDVVVHDVAVADVGFHGVDDLEALGLVGADGHLVALVHREVEGIETALAGEALVEADGG